MATVLLTDFPWGDDAPDAKHLNACDKDCVTWGKKNHVDETAMRSR